MATWSDGYFTDAEYVDGYFRELSPLYLNFNLTLAGYDVGASDRVGVRSGFSYLELGFGRGSSLNIHAATYDGQFAGTDFNPTHALLAQKNAGFFETDSIQKSKTQKVNPRDYLKIYDLSFKELLDRFEEERPSFDYIVFHGIYSWIDENNRAIMRQIVQNFLKPGGVVYNSYNCFPGWSSKAPVREILSLHKELNPASTAQMITNAVGFLDKFLATNPAFAAGNAQISALVNSLKEKGASTYIAHEYMNKAWECFYFYDLAQEFAASKCDFATTAEILEKFDEFSLSPEASEFLHGVDNALFKEQLKDYYINRQFRKDIFVKGAVRISVAQRLDKLKNTRFVLLRDPKEFNPKLQVARGELSLNAELHEKVLNFMSDYKPKSGTEILEGAKIDDNALLNVLAIFVSQGFLYVAQDDNADFASLQARANFYNRALFSRQKTGIAGNFAASAIIGSAITMSDTDILVCGLCNEGKNKPKEIEGQISDIFKNSSRRAMRDGKIIEDEKEHEKEISKIVKAALEKMPIYKAAGIVE